MPIYRAPIKEMAFLMREVFPGPWEETLAWESVEDVLTALGRYASQQLFHLNRLGDEMGCQWREGAVSVPHGFTDAFTHLKQQGWLGWNGPELFGGRQWPLELSVLAREILWASIPSLAMTVEVTEAVSHAVREYGDEDLKQAYLDRLVSGEWAGALCVTEKGAGSSLDNVDTEAFQRGEGRWGIRGTKMFVAAGDHDLTDNIVYLVLARTQDAPRGSDGLSLFLVPKWLPDEDELLAEENEIDLQSVEHTMGMKGMPTCTLHFDKATGYLLGELHQGMEVLFSALNPLRIACGIQGMAATDVAYQMAVEYAKERLQGRAPTGPVNLSDQADPIIVHPQVRRSLLQIRSMAEGGRAMVAFLAEKTGQLERAEDEQEREDLENTVAVLVPLLKAFMSEAGLQSALTAQDVYGGYGYLRDWGIEQLVRDVRATHSYAGSNNIQAMDLLQRKILNGFEWVAPLLREMDEFVHASLDEPELTEFLSPLLQSIARFTEVTQWVLLKAPTTLHEVGSAATPYLQLLGHTLMTYLWAKMAKGALAIMSQDRIFAEAKLHTARFYHAKVLPITQALVQEIKAGSATLYRIPEEQF